MFATMGCITAEPIGDFPAYEQLASDGDLASMAALCEAAGLHSWEDAEDHFGSEPSLGVAGDPAQESRASNQHLAKWCMALLAVSSTALQASRNGSQEGWPVASRGDCALAEE